MAWNEPGGGNKDPWGNNNQGPPDLDEALKKMKDQLRGVFGGDGGGASSGGNDISWGMLGILLAALVVVWAGAGFYQVDAKEQAVILRLGQFHDTVGPGLHWNPVFVDRRYVVNVTQERDYKADGLMLTKDENIVGVPVSVQFKIGDPKAYVLNVRDPETSLKHATDSAIRHVVGSTASSDVLSEGREILGRETRDRLQSYLDLYNTGITITRINVLEAKPPTEVKSAFDDVIAAKEDKDRYKNEAEAYANGIVPEARGRAQRILQEAIAYRDRLIAEANGDARRFDLLYSEYRKAPQVTRERLYLDAIESVMSNSSKVLVDVEGGNNMMYLPLDKIVSQPSSSSARISSSDLDQITREITEKLRREQSTRSRRGESR